MAQRIDGIRLNIKEIEFMNGDIIKNKRVLMTENFLIMEASEENAEPIWHNLRKISAMRGVYEPEINAEVDPEIDPEEGAEDGTV